MPLLGTIASQFSGKSFGSFESIATASGTGSSGVITFSSIPSGYASLQIRVLGRSDYAGVQDDFNIRINGDTGSNYSIHGMSGSGSTLGTFGAASQTMGGNTYYAWLPGASAAASIMGVSIINIHDYASTTKNKTIRGIASVDRNGSGSVNLFSTGWLSTSAITSLTLITNSSGNFTTATTIGLYGIKG